MSHSVKVLGPLPTYLLRGDETGTVHTVPFPLKIRKEEMSEYKTQNPEEKSGGGRETYNKELMSTPNKELPQINTKKINNLTEKRAQDKRRQYAEK